MFPKTFKRAVAVFLCFAVMISIIPQSFQADALSFFKTTTKADFKLELYKYDKTSVDSEGIGSLGDMLNPDGDKAIVTPGDEIVVLVKMEKYEKPFGFSGIEYSLGYDPGQVTLMTSPDTGSGVVPPEGSEQTDFQNAYWNKLNPGKLKPANDIYGEFRISNFDPFGALDSAVEGQREIQAYIYNSNGESGIPYDKEANFTGSADDQTIGVYIFKVNDKPSPTPGVKPLSVFTDDGSIVISNFTADNYVDSTHIVKGGAGDADFDAVFNPPVDPEVDIEINLPDVNSIIISNADVYTGIRDVEISKMSDGTFIPKDSIVKIYSPDNVLMAEYTLTETTTEKTPAKFTIERHDKSNLGGDFGVSVTLPGKLESDKVSIKTNPRDNNIKTDSTLTTPTEPTLEIGRPIKDVISKKGTDESDKLPTLPKNATVTYNPNTGSESGTYSAKAALGDWFFGPGSDLNSVGIVKTSTLFEENIIAIPTGNMKVVNVGTEADNKIRRYAHMYIRMTPPIFDYIMPVAPVYTSADDEKLKDTKSDKDVIDVLFPTTVKAVKSDGRILTLVANWGPDAGVNNKFDPKGQTYTYKTNINGVVANKQLAGQQAIVTPVTGKLPAEVKDSTIILPKDSTVTYAELLAMFPKSNGNIELFGSIFGNVVGPTYSIAWTPNALPGDWDTSVAGKEFKFTGAITTGPIDRWLTYNDVKSITITVKIDDMDDIVIIDPLPTYPDDPNTEGSVDPFKGHLTSADDKLIEKADTTQDISDLTLPNLLEVGKLVDGKVVSVGYMKANWNFVSAINGSTKDKIEYKKESYSYSSSVDGVKAQIDAKSVVTAVKGSLDVATPMDIFLTQEQREEIFTYEDLVKYFPSRNGDIKLVDNKPYSNVPYTISWAPGSLPEDFFTVQKGTFKFNGAVSLTKPRWLTEEPTIPSEVIVNVHVDNSKTIVDIVDPADKFEETYADDARVNKASSVDSIIALLPQNIEVEMSDGSTVFVPANWIPDSQKDSQIELKGKVYNFTSGILGLPAVVDQSKGQVSVISVKGEPDDTFKDATVEIPLGNTISSFEELVKLFPQGSNFVLPVGKHMPGTVAPYIIDWNPNTLSGFNPQQPGATKTFKGKLNHLSANWLTYDDTLEITVTVKVADLPIITPEDGNHGLAGNKDIYMYVNRGFRDNDTKLVNLDGTEFTDPYTITRFVEKYSSITSTTIASGSKKDLPEYNPTEDLTLGNDGENSYGKYRITYNSTIYGNVLPAVTKDVYVIYLRGDINKDGILNGQKNDTTSNTDMGLFNRIVKRQEKYNNGESDVDYMANLVNAGPFNGSFNPTAAFRVHNQERLEKLISGIIEVAPQLFGYLVEGEDAHTNKHKIKSIND